MPAEPQNPAVIECRTVDGRLLALLRLGCETRVGEAHPLVRWPDAEAQARGEEPVQLRERCRWSRISMVTPSDCACICRESAPVPLRSATIQYPRPALRPVSPFFSGG
jgi:hypothetical protein